MHTRYTELLDRTKRNFERLLGIERELLRRYQLGDSAAWLPLFGPKTQPQPEK